jgi:hypothetical protein
MSSFAQTYPFFFFFTHLSQTVSLLSENRCDKLTRELSSHRAHDKREIWNSDKPVKRFSLFLAFYQKSFFPLSIQKYLLNTEVTSICYGTHYATSRV